MFEDTITLFHTIDNGTFVRIILKNIYFKQSDGIIDSSTQISNSEGGIIVIPTDTVIIYDYSYDDVEEITYKDLLNYELQIMPR